MTTHIIYPASGGFLDFFIQEPAGHSPYDVTTPALVGGDEALKDNSDSTYAISSTFVNEGAGGDETLGSNITATTMEPLIGDDPIVGSFRWYVRYRGEKFGDADTLNRIVGVSEADQTTRMFKEDHAVAFTDGGPFQLYSGFFDEFIGGDAAIIDCLRSGTAQMVFNPQASLDRGTNSKADFYVSEMWLTYETADDTFTVMPSRRKWPREDGLAGSTHRHWPPPNTRQGSGRRVASTI